MKASLFLLSLGLVACGQGESVKTQNLPPSNQNQAAEGSSEFAGGGIWGTSHKRIYFETRYGACGIDTSPNIISDLKGFDITYYYNASMINNPYFKAEVAEGSQNPKTIKAYDIYAGVSFSDSSLFNLTERIDMVGLQSLTTERFSEAGRITYPVTIKIDGVDTEATLTLFMNTFTSAIQLSGVYRIETSGCAFEGNYYLQ